MRSRASGGICGDSSAAPSAATMSSLRRRAIWVQRARSIARSSTGGRASARTTAPASPGSTSSRSQATQVAHLGALEEGGGAREAVGHGALLQRRGDRLALAADRADEHADLLGRDVLAGDEPLDVGGDGLRLRALVGAAPERDLAAGRAAAARFVDPRRVGRDHRAGRGEHALRRAARGSRAARPSASGQSARKSATLFVDAPRKRVIAWSSSAATVTRPCSAASSRSSRVCAKLVSWNSSTSTCAKRAARRARTCGLARRRRNACSDEVAEVERARLGEHAVVRGVDRGELALARRARPVRLGLLGQRGRPGRVVARP